MPSKRPRTAIRNEPFAHAGSASRTAFTLTLREKNHALSKSIAAMPSALYARPCAGADRAQSEIAPARHRLLARGDRTEGPVGVDLRTSRPGFVRPRRRRGRFREAMHPGPRKHREGAG